MALKGKYTSAQRKTKQGSYRLYKKYKEAVMSGNMDLAKTIHHEGVDKYNEDFAGRFHKLGKHKSSGKYGEKKKKMIKYG